MDKNAFISLLKRHNSSSEKELIELISLKEQFPFSQVLQTMVARAGKDYNMENQAALLQEAAIYSADRAVLKDIFSDPFVERVVTVDSANEVGLPEQKAEVVAPDETITHAQVSKTEDDSPAPAPSLETLKITSQIDAGIDYADEVIRDLERLNSLRHNFEMMFVEYSEVESTPVDEAVTRETEEEKQQPEAPDAETSTTDEQPEAKGKKSKKARIVEMAKSLGVTQQLADGEPKRTSTKRKGASEALIDEIQSSKEELSPENDKQKEQIEIINQFIRTQPSISPVKERTVSPPGDLNPIKSGEFGDNIVSETLVEILIKQGKKEKAIEVLKKLIWKYPQKKTYFASQIEDLKK